MNLTERLQEHGYTEEAVIEAFGVRDVFNLKIGEIPAYGWRCRRLGTPAATLASLFLGRQLVPRDTVAELLGAENLRWLLAEKLLREAAGGRSLAAQADLYPVCGAYVFTDPALLITGAQPGHVYQLGSDSYPLARCTPRPAHGRALDLCTGSGVHAVLAGLPATGVDLNPRALAFARRNAELNGTHCTFLEGDLYQPVDGGPYSLITANPPFVPTPDTEMLIHRTGGESGEEISQRLVAGLPAHLEAGGTFAMVLDYPVLQSSRYVERLVDWLGGPAGWGVVVADLSRRTPLEYIGDHINFTQEWSAYRTELIDYLESYAEQGIEEVRAGLVYIRRLRTRTSWTVETEMAFDPVDRSRQVAAWLDALERTRDPDWEWEGLTPALTATVYRGDHDGWLSRDDAWPRPRRLTADQARVASAFDGTRTAGQIAQTEAAALVRETLALLSEELALRPEIKQ